MAHMNNLVETLVGTAVLLVAALFSWYVYANTDIGRGRDGYVIRAVFDNASGVNIGTDVRLAGLKVGSVIDQRLDGETYQAIISMTIDPQVKLPRDSSAKITTDGLLGDKYIALDPGGDEEMLKDGEVLENTQSSIDLWGLVNEYLFKEERKNK